MLVKGAMQSAPRQPARAGPNSSPAPVAFAATAAPHVLVGSSLSASSVHVAARVLTTSTTTTTTTTTTTPPAQWTAAGRFGPAPTVSTRSASAFAGGNASRRAAPSWVCLAAPATAPAGARLELGSEDTGLGRYRCHSKDGALVDAVVDARSPQLIVVRITASYANVPHRAPQELQLHWGMYRASGTKWHHPREAVPPDSSPEPGGNGAMRTAMTWDERGGVWAVRFEVPAQLAPLHLAFALYQPAVDKYDNPLRAPHFCVPVGMGAGRPEPLGASVVATKPGGGDPTDPRDAACAVNFAVFSRHASSIQLCLVRVKVPSAVEAAAAGGPQEPLAVQNVLEIVLDPLTHRTGDVWHICVHGLKDLESLCWAWRADGEILWQNGNRFHPGFMLMDPWATRAVPVLLPEGAHKAAPRLPPSQRPDEPVLLGSLAAFVHSPFDWQGSAVPAGLHGGQSRVRALEEGVVVELDVAAFTSGPDAQASVPPEHQGKYLGILGEYGTHHHYQQTDARAPLSRYACATQHVYEISHMHPYTARPVHHVYNLLLIFSGSPLQYSNFPSCDDSPLVRLIHMYGVVLRIAGLTVSNPKTLIMFRENVIQARWRPVYLLFFKAAFLRVSTPLRSRSPDSAL
ncbi:hypothetical protein Vretimale_5868 [Volvox reticuliferus]|uniref:Uncharacterized protein n=1 Tax=Volvox reticuliferus TaxID=1737510 RepID=A0A8J4LKZ9_9CHLO|nr:hypothetical protein Vretifemale_5924 [Volvox reticuliferus]GIM01020.1 hypothetical protein Vretimale_5868 [Volvox reticuliferus]